MNKTTIKAEVVADSLSIKGDRLTSLRITFPRIILAEVNTHRMLSKNTSSSRAIPFKKMVEAVKNDPFIPIAWQKDHKGMQGEEYLTNKEDIIRAEKDWLNARTAAVQNATYLYMGAGVTKQLCNRLLEPFMWTTMLITGSKEGWDNFFSLRCPQYEIGLQIFKSKKECVNILRTLQDPSPEILGFDKYDWFSINKGQAEIHMMALAEAIYDAMNESTPKQLKAGEYHIPMIKIIED